MKRLLAIWCQAIEDRPCGIGVIKQWVYALAVIALGFFLPVLMAQPPVPPTPGQQPQPTPTSTNEFKLLVEPSTNQVLVEGTTNQFAVTVTNANLFTNMTMTGLFGMSTNLISFTDPDQDNRFTGLVATPNLSAATRFDLRLRSRGEDLTAADTAEDEPVIAATTNRFTYTVVPRPRNDDFTNAFKIAAEGAVIQHTNNFASLEPREPKHAEVATTDASVWWDWSPKVASEVLIDAAGSSFNAVLAVYTGNELQTLTSIASSTNDVVNDLPPNVTFKAARGKTYRIAVAGLDSSTNSVGDIRLRVAPGAEPDTHPPQVVIDSEDRNVLTDRESFLLSGTAREPVANDSGISNIVFEVNGARLDELPTSLSGDPRGLVSWQSRVPLPPGDNVVQAFAKDYAGNLGPPDTLMVRFISPTNDMFRHAVQLEGTSGFEAAVNDDATKEEGEPLHADNEGGHSIWYRWRAPANGSLQLNTRSSDFDTLLAVYTGSQLSNLTRVASNDDAEGQKTSALTMAVSSNQLYQIAVDGFGGDSGQAGLQYAFQPTEAEEFFNVAIASSPGGSVSPSGGAFPANSEVTLTARPDANFEFSEWQGDVTSEQNPLALEVDRDMSVKALFEVSRFTENFETGDFSKLPWSSPSDQSWHVQGNAMSGGDFAAKSGSIRDGGTSSLALEMSTGAGTASFDFRVSSEPDWDFLVFYLNGRALRRWSGDVGWQRFSFSVPRGLNKLEWRYEKDGSFGVLRDAAFIDNVYVPPAPTSDDVSNELTIHVFPEGAQITLEALPSREYTIEASSDLQRWEPIKVKSSVSGVIHILDTEAVDKGRRFYRAVAR